MTMCFPMRKDTTLHNPSPHRHLTISSQVPTESRRKKRGNLAKWRGSPKQRKGDGKEGKCWKELYLVSFGFFGLNVSPIVTRCFPIYFNMDLMVLKI